MSGESSTCLAKFFKLIVAGLNVPVLAIGVFIMVFSRGLGSSGWLDVFEEKYPWMSEAVFWLVFVFGLLVVFLAIMGIVGACTGNNCMLSIYNFFVGLALIIFLLLTIAAFASTNTAKDWKSKDYPAHESEPKAAKSFNKVYCMAQAVYYCNDGPVNDTLRFFFPNVNPVLRAELKNYETVSAACEDGKDTAPGIGNVCSACVKTESVSQYSGVNSWALRECPLELANPGPLLWCSKFLITDKPGPGQYTGAPYGQCREPVLEFWEKWSVGLGVASVFFMILCIIILVFVCCSQAKRKRTETQA